MIIYGAGMSGLLAAQMLKRHNPVVYEAAPSLPNNHGALLRFRSDKVEKATGIKLKKVWVQKAVANHDNFTLTTFPDIRLQNMYSMKVTGEIKPRSIMNLEAGERYIAPDDFCEQLAKGVDIKYNEKLTGLDTKTIHKDNTVISTIPMPELMKIVGWSDMPKFEFKSITTVNARIVDMKCDVYQTIYFPSPRTHTYRASITGNRLIVEMVGEQEFKEAELVDSGMLQLFFGAYDGKLSLEDITVKTQKYGKLIPSENKSRKEFILAMTDLHNIYSLGRFGTWRQILMDDVVKDVGIIDEMVSERSSYSRRLKYGI